MIKVTKKTGQFQLPSEDTHRAAIVGVYCIGTVYSEKFDSESEKLIVMFELLDEKTDSGDPFTLCKTYTKSLNEKSNLFKELGPILGVELEADEPDLEVLLGRNVNIYVEHYVATDGKRRASIRTVSPLSKKEKPKQPTLNIHSFDFGQELSEDIPEWIQTKIKASPEWNRVEAV